MSQSKHNDYEVSTARNLAALEIVNHTTLATLSQQMTLRLGIEIHREI